jgi:hypothetical protein
VEVEISIKRTKWLRESTTIAELPFAETLTSVGQENNAFEPTPSEESGGNPAKILTSAVDRRIFRITELRSSPIKA